MPYGVSNELWHLLPPDDQAAVAALAQGLPIPQIGGYANLQPIAATPAPPPTLTATPPGVGGRPSSAGFMEIPKTPVRATILPAAKSPEVVQNTLAAREARVGAVGDDMRPWPEPNDALFAPAVRAPTQPRVTRVSAPVARPILSARLASHSSLSPPQAQAAHRHGEPVVTPTRLASRTPPSPPPAQIAHRHGESVVARTRLASRTPPRPPEPQTAHRHGEPVVALDSRGVGSSHHGGGIVGAITGGLKWVGLQVAAAQGSLFYSEYFVDRAEYHAASHIPGGFVAQPFLAVGERVGLRGDMLFDKIEHRLGDSRGEYDEGPQTQGTVPIVHWGPKLNLPGAHQGGKEDLDPLIPKRKWWLPKWP